MQGSGRGAAYLQEQKKARAAGQPPSEAEAFAQDDVKKKETKSKLFSFSFSHKQKANKIIGFPASRLLNYLFAIIKMYIVKFCR